MKKFTTTKKIRKELSRLGYDAHGKKCMVSIYGTETEAIIHCKDVPKDQYMKWYFCQDIECGRCRYSGDKHGKKYSWLFLDDEDLDGIDWFHWLEEETKVKNKLEVIQEKKVRYTDSATVYTANGLTIKGETKTPEEWKDLAKQIRREVARHKKLLSNKTL